MLWPKIVFSVYIIGKTSRLYIIGVKGYDTDEASDCYVDKILCHVNSSCFPIKVI